MDRRRPRREARRASAVYLDSVDQARRIIGEADIRPGDRILEPSAGTGRLIDAAAELTFAETLTVCAVESNPALASALRFKYPSAFVHCGDFLEFTPPADRFDVVVMNPPFSDQADIRHVMHAATFLRPSGRLVAIMSAGVAFRCDKLATGFRAFVQRRRGEIRPLPPDSFRQSGTGVSTVLVRLGAE